ncbi:hypothetical protein GX50_08985, partial [[Emmonsia] crescens]
NIKTITHYSYITLTVRDIYLIIKIAKTLKSDYFSDTDDII